ncbi:MAG: hypothetical protein ABIN18_05595 [Pseudomonadota bacterium]
MAGTGRLFPKSFEGQAPREFGMGANILKTRTFTLTVARDLEEIEIGGSCLWAIAATSLGAWIDIRVNDQLRDPVRFQQGMFIRGIPFSRLFVTHDAQAGETITLFFAVEAEVNNIEIVNPSIGFNNINVTKATVLDTVADVALAAAATTQILAANAARRQALITNLAANASTFRIGDAAAAAARGVELAPGETIGLETTEAIFGYNPGAIQSVGVAWTED